MSGSKTFINNSNYELSLTLIVRNGDDPANGNVEGQNVTFTLAAGTQAVQSYGNKKHIYLNGLSYAWTDDDARLEKTQTVKGRGSWLDDLLNTNSIITINKVGRGNLIGSN